MSRIQFTLHCKRARSSAARFVALQLRGSEQLSARPPSIVKPDTSRQARIREATAASRARSRSQVFKMETAMNGAESLVHTLLRAAFGLVSPTRGTSEMHFVAALDRIPGMRLHSRLDRERGHRRGGRLRPNDARPGSHLIALRSWARQRSFQPPQRTPGTHAGRQRGGRSCQLPSRLRSTSGRGHGGVGSWRFRLDSHRRQRGDHWARWRHGDPGGREPVRARSQP